MSRRIAVIGCGRIANKRHLPLLASGAVPGLTLGAVCDIDEERARKAGQEYGVPWYQSIEDLGDCARFDAITIATPSGLHAKHIYQCLQYEVPLIVEKPLALTLNAAEEVYALAQLAGVPLFTVMQNRFNRPIYHLYHAIHSGRLGEVFAANVTVRWCRHADYYTDWHGTWAMAGGVLANQAIHHIDLLGWMLGEPQSVFAYASSSTPGIEVEDTLVGVIRFVGGALATVEVTAATRPQDLEGSITVLGTKGSVKVGGFAVNTIDIWKFNESQEVDEAILRSCESPPDVYGYGHTRFYEHVLNCLETQSDSAIDGRTSIRLVTALYESVETQSEVKLSNGYEPHSSRLGVA